MELLFWDVRNLLVHALGDAYLQVLLVTFLFFWDYPLLLLHGLAVRSWPGRLHRRQDGSAPAPPILVVIPSLLRRRDELDSMRSTITSVTSNGYPGELTIVISIDGTHDAPDLYRELCAFAKSGAWGERTALHVTGTAERRGKPMAIDHGVGFVKELVREGALRRFPPVYVSTDADADLGPHALEAIVRRLQRRNPITGAPPAIVAGGLHVRGNSFWQGWRSFFTVSGQLNLQVAREYYVSNVGRYNIRALPVTGVPGAFYCTWSEIFLAIPHFLGYMRTLRTSHWLRWWLGDMPPRFAGSSATPLPELMAGDTDDTVTAYIATMARYQDGRFTLDPPRSPIHALLYMLRTILLARPIQYEPQARVYTSSPTTIKGLFRQRRRWNSSRVELTVRLWPALAFHWTIGLPALVVLGFLSRSFVFGLLAYVYVPFFLFRGHVVAGALVAYLCQVLVFGTVTLAALLQSGEVRYWRLALALPLLPFYNFAFNWVPAAVGAASDVLLFGNVTGFSPEWTLKRGGSVRIALLYRARRAAALLARSVSRGDVPLGAFWLGWRESAWTPSGFEGWTTGKRPPVVAVRPPPRA